MNVLSVDPGKTTGYVLWKDGERIEDELPCQRFLTFAAAVIERGDVDHVVCERFTVGALTAKSSQAPWSLEQIGVLRYLCNRHGVSFHLQNVADAKRFGSEERLNRIGWARPKGHGHARDAQRHLLVFLAKNGWSDTNL